MARDLSRLPSKIRNGKNRGFTDTATLTGSKAVVIELINTMIQDYTDVKVAVRGSTLTGIETQLGILKTSPIAIREKYRTVLEGYGSKRAKINDAAQDSTEQAILLKTDELVDIHKALAVAVVNLLSTAKDSTAVSTAIGNYRTAILALKIPAKLEVPEKEASKNERTGINTVSMSGSLQAVIQLIEGIATIYAQVGVLAKLSANDGNSD